MTARILKMRLITATAIAWGAWITPAEAQTQQVLYPVKIVCGFQEGTVPRLGSSSQGVPYEGFKPGNYATTVNIINLDGPDQGLTPVFTSSSVFLAVLLGPTNPLTTLGTLSIGCPEIADAINQLPARTLDGEFFEGFLTIAAGTSALRVQAVYTFESKNDASAAGRGLGSSIDVETIEGFDIANRPAAVAAFKRLLKERDSNLGNR